MQRVYLTRRNLLTLLSKLDRKAGGEITSCTLIKQDINHALYPCTDVIMVTAIEDAAYYIDREPGEVLIVDDPNKAVKCTEDCVRIGYADPNCSKHGGRL